MTKSAPARIAFLLADGFSDEAFSEVRRNVNRHRAIVDIIALTPHAVHGGSGGRLKRKLNVDWTIDEVRVADYDGVYIAGGLMSADLLRQNERLLVFVRRANAEALPIATIGHGAAVLASAGLAKGRRVTSSRGIRDDLENAGAFWENNPVVRDSNWLIGRDEEDLPEFVEQLAHHFQLGAERPSMIRTWLPWLAGSAVVGTALYFGKKELDRRTEEHKHYPTV